MTKKPALPTIVQPLVPAKTTWVANEYITAATSDNTRKAYRADVAHFERWGGRLPATPEMIVAYLHYYAQILNPRTLARRVTAIKNWHLYQQFIDPTNHAAVIKTLSGINRIHGRPKEKAHALTPEDLQTLMRQLQLSDNLSHLRDRALILVGYFGAFRRSELVAIYHEHIKWEKEGIDILIPSSKTDQSHSGQFCAIPYGQQPLCPINALKNWLTAAGIEQGPIFRRIHHDTISQQALTPLSVNHILKKRAAESGIAYVDAISSHSLRRGLATSASRMGAGLPAIMRQGRWKQVNTVMEYIEAGERFNENAATSIMQKIKNEKCGE